MTLLDISGHIEKHVTHNRHKSSRCTKFDQ